MTVQSIAAMTPIAGVFKKEFLHKKEFLKNDLKSLGIDPKKENELNDETELRALTEIIKQVYYQDYKTAYSGNSNNRMIITNHEKERPEFLMRVTNNVD
jgi:hypothetical protein